MSDSHVIREPAGTITVTPSVLARVVRGSAGRVDGARVRRGRRGLAVEVDGGRARVTLELAVRYGIVLPDVARNVQQRVAEGLRTMCGLEPARIDVAIEELEG
jgi:uncharacterized alkaline shock family protein YloU